MVNPWKTYVKLSAVLMGSHGLTKGSLAFLNYPAQIMFKSTKVSCIRQPCLEFHYILYLEEILRIPLFFLLHGASTGTSCNGDGCFYSWLEKEVPAPRICLCSSSSFWFDHFHPSRCQYVSKFQCHWCCDGIWCSYHGCIPGKSAGGNFHYKSWNHTSNVVEYLVINLGVKDSPDLIILVLICVLFKSCRRRCYFVQQ